jgi:hypothetical protein
VTLVNPKIQKQKVALGKISGLWGIDKFHGLPIPKFWIKIDIAIAHVVDVPLMHTHEADDQFLMKDVVGTSTLWNWKYVKIDNVNYNDRVLFYNVWLICT